MPLIKEDLQENKLFRFFVYLFLLGMIGFLVWTIISYS